MGKKCVCVMEEILKKGLEVIANEACPMDYGKKGTEKYCGFNQELETDCISCWKEAFKIDIDNPTIKADFKVGGSC